MRNLKYTFQNGFTLVEVMIAIAVASMIAATLIHGIIQIREQFHRWKVETLLEQEALRFFTYFENRNACAVSWGTNRSMVVIESCETRNSKNIQREFYKYGDHIIERDLENGGTITLSFYVKEVEFITVGDKLEIQLTLSKEGITKTYSKSMVRSIGL